MPILERASVELRQRLLDMFPVTNLRSAFSLRGNKETITKQLATGTSKAHLDDLAKFVDDHLALCKQHIYVFASDEEVAIPEALDHAERVSFGDDHALFIARVEYQVVKEEPLEYDSIDFLWPVRIERRGTHLLVKFAVLEKSIPSYFTRNVFVRGKSLTEELITKPLLLNGTLGIADFNKGIKHLWATDKIDATRIKYMKPGSTNTQSMHEAKELKKNDPDAYEELKQLPLYTSIFIGHEELAALGTFAVSPSEGFIGFTHFATEGETGDELIQQILANN